MIKNKTNRHTDKAINNITMYYDDACVICSTEAHNMHERNPQGITLTSVDEGLDELQAAGFSRSDAMTYICIQTDTNDWYTHMDAIRLLYSMGGLKWAPLLYLPVIKQFGDFIYPVVARNRYRIPHWVTKLIYGKAVIQACESGVCSIAPDKR